LSARRDRRVDLLNLGNLFIGGGVGAVGSGLQLISSAEHAGNVVSTSAGFGGTTEVLQDDESVETLAYLKGKDVDSEEAQKNTSHSSAGRLSLLNRRQFCRRQNVFRARL